MINVSIIAILGIICMYACYKPICSYFKNLNQTSKKAAGQDKNIGLFIFTVIFAAALLSQKL